MPEPSLVVDVSDRIATITLNRPAVLNALDPELSQRLAAALETIRDDDTVAAVVLTGAGRGFCAGGDARAMAEGVAAGADLPQLVRDVLAFLNGAVMAIRRMEKPVIAAVNGVASGAGISLAAACDLRYAAASATFKPAYTSLGLTPDVGWTVLVPALVGFGTASELLLRDRPFDAAEAHRIGLVNGVVDDDRLGGEVRAIAGALAEGAPGVSGQAKRLLDEAGLRHLERQLERERDTIAELMSTPAFQSRLRAFLAR